MKRKYKAYSENAPGDFYVECDLCITCRNPEHAAPTLIGFSEADSGISDHCFFKKQPETPMEIELAIKAVGANCCGSYRYGGSNTEIKARLREQGDLDSIDNP